MNYSFSYSSTNAGVIWASLAVGLIIWIIWVIGLWKTFQKAGLPGWAAIIPVYQYWVWVKLATRPSWYFWVYLAAVLLSWIPIVGIILAIVVFITYLMTCFSVSRNFGHGGGFAIGLWLLSFIFVLILGFGGDQYKPVPA